MKTLYAISNMRPIMFTEVRARLRSIDVLTVQMIQAITERFWVTRRQISPVSRSNMRTLPSLTGEIPEGGSIRQPDRKNLQAVYPCRPLACLSGNSSSQTAPEPLDRQPHVTLSRYMHACNYTKKFISYKSHLLLDAKYLIMASTAMLVVRPTFSRWI
jgi:hypothetical protein